MAAFKSHDDYRLFAQSVIRRGRYVFEPPVDEFLGTVLGTVLSTVGDRLCIIERDSMLYRAQLGFEWREMKIDTDDPESDTIEIEEAYDIPRMKPPLTKLRWRAGNSIVSSSYIRTKSLIGYHPTDSNLEWS